MNNENTHDAAQQAAADSADSAATFDALLAKYRLSRMQEQDDLWLFQSSDALLDFIDQHAHTIRAALRQRDGDSGEGGV